MVDVIFSLKTNTAAGKDSILSRDINELLETSKVSENWKNVETLEFMHAKQNVENRKVFSEL